MTAKRQHESNTTDATVGPSLHARVLIRKAEIEGRSRTRRIPTNTIVLAVHERAAPVYLVTSTNASSFARPNRSSRCAAITIGCRRRS